VWNLKGRGKMGKSLLDQAVARKLARYEEGGKVGEEEGKEEAKDGGAEYYREEDAKMCK
jgi:hypothetical protein